MAILSNSQRIGNYEVNNDDQYFRLMMPNIFAVTAQTTFYEAIEKG